MALVAAACTFQTEMPSSLTSDGPLGEPGSYLIGGNLNGLAAGNTLELLNHGETLALSANGPFVFTSPSLAYDVQLGALTGPVAQTCTVQAGQGTATADVTNVAVECGPPLHRVGGTITGLRTPTKLTLTLGATTETFAAGAYFFSNRVPTGTAYHVSLQKPEGYSTCSLENAAGTIGDEDVTNVNASCPPDGAVGGSISGLPTDGSVTLRLTAGAKVVQQVFNNGPFEFDEFVSTGTNYAVVVTTVSTNTPNLGYTCKATGATAGIKPATPVTDLSIACAPTPIMIGLGQLTGLPTGQTLGLLLNGIQHPGITAAGDLRMLPSGTPYTVTIFQQPNAAECTVAPASGTVGIAKINLTVSCSPKVTFQVYGLTDEATTVARVTLNGVSNKVTLSQRGRYVMNTLGNGWHSGTIQTQPVASNDLWCNIPTRLASVNASTGAHYDVYCGSTCKSRYRAGLIADNNVEQLIDINGAEAGGETKVRCRRSAAGDPPGIGAWTLLWGDGITTSAAEASQLAILSDRVLVGESANPSRYIWSKPNQLPILNLRTGRILNKGCTSNCKDYWNNNTGYHDGIFNTVTAVDEPWPAIYWANGNGSGIHIVPNVLTIFAWSLSNSSTNFPAADLQVWVE